MGGGPGNEGGASEIGSPESNVIKFPTSLYWVCTHHIIFLKCWVRKAITSVDNHPLGSYLPPAKENKYNLRKKQCALPKVNTEHKIR